ncbi:kinase-like domain-containing protein [Gigaspora rosea]|uniref:Kinase-like domain-containing protein n=1 Tax=Gigaspora rosea TaxID=44941 RepID=A0A397UEH6_9GLOM|nr:kinase-like domain-containing protein [Gigaspora rosea]
MEDVLLVMMITRNLYGGFGSVYLATWLDGIRKVEKINSNNYYKKSRESNSIVALKTLTSSKENNFDPLKEYVNNGSLYKYLKNNFDKLLWQTKLQILKDISQELNYIHYYANYIHADFYSGNILQDQCDNKNISYIADLGLSRKLNESVPKGMIYGVMPYVAPEVLLGEQQFTRKADIYGLGIIMAEISTGQRPFDGHKFDTKLAIKIIKRERPEFASKTPKCYIELAKQCMDSDPQKRPDAWEIDNKISKWLDNDEIKKQFLDANKVIKSLPISKHPDEIYTSKLISTKIISNAIKDLSQANSGQIKLNITVF